MLVPAFMFVHLETLGRLYPSPFPLKGSPSKFLHLVIKCSDCFPVLAPNAGPNEKEVNKFQTLNVW